MSFFDALRAIASRVVFVDEATQAAVFDAIAEEEAAANGGQAVADPDSGVPAGTATPSTTPVA